MFKKIGVFLVGLMFSALALAQTTPDTGVDAITALGAKASAYIAAAFTVAILVAGGFWGIAMMKKAFSRAK